MSMFFEDLSFFFLPDYNGLQILKLQAEGPHVWEYSSFCQTIWRIFI